MKRSTRQDNLDWLVKARNRIQELMLRLYRARNAMMPDVDWQFALGSAFSLWRAVFLSHQIDDRPAKVLKRQAVNFLERVIERNAIAFSDDLFTHVTSSPI